MPSICMWLHHVEVDRTSIWRRLGVARNVNSVIGGMYLGITCGLTQPWGTL